jgi:hypothetical protein
MEGPKTDGASGTSPSPGLSVLHTRARIAHQDYLKDLPTSLWKAEDEGCLPSRIPPALALPPAVALALAVALPPALALPPAVLLTPRGCPVSCFCPFDAPRPASRWRYPRSSASRDPPQSPVLEEGGVFLLAPSRSLLPAFNFWTRAGMCRGPYRRRMGVDFKIGVGGHTSPRLAYSSPASAGPFLVSKHLGTISRVPDLLWCGRRPFRSMTKLEPRFGGAFFALRKARSTVARGAHNPRDFRNPRFLPMRV